MDYPKRINSRFCVRCRVNEIIHTSFRVPWLFVENLRTGDAMHVVWDGDHVPVRKERDFGVCVRRVTEKGWRQLGQIDNWKFSITSFPALWYNNINPVCLFI